MSFNNEDILVLAKAGFTADQIAALNAVGNTPAPEATAPAPEAPAPAPEAPAPAPEAPAPEAPKQGATIDDVLSAISGLTKTFQNGNLLMSQQPTPPSAEDILAEIINPPTKQS